MSLCSSLETLWPPSWYSRRADFEALLASYQTEVDKLQELEVSRQLAEIKKMVEQLAVLGGNLEASKEEAMVSSFGPPSCPY